MSAPRRSREVHAEPVCGPLVVWGGQTEGESYIPLRTLPRPAHDEPHGPGLADCVCEEPCRYCRCEPT